MADPRSTALYRRFRAEAEHAGMPTPAVGEDLEAVAVPQPDVGQDDVVKLGVDRRGGLGTTGCRVHLVPLFPEPLGHRGQHVPIVVYQKERTLVHTIT